MNRKSRIRNKSHTYNLSNREERFRIEVYQKQSELEARINALEGTLIGNRQRMIDELLSLVARLIGNGQSLPTNINPE